MNHLSEISDLLHVYPNFLSKEVCNEIIEYAEKRPNIFRDRSKEYINSGIHGDAGATQTRGNVNHLINIQSPTLASIFKEEFAQMWGDGPGGLKNSRFGRNKTSQPLRTVKVGSMNISVLFPPHAKTHSGHGLEDTFQHWTEG